MSSDECWAVKHATARWSQSSRYKLAKNTPHFKPVATEGVYEYDAWQERIQPILKELDEALYQNSDLYAHFKVHVFEWESGY